MDIVDPSSIPCIEEKVTDSSFVVSSKETDMGKLSAIDLCP